MTLLHRVLGGIAATLACAAALVDTRPAADAAAIAAEVDTGRDHISVPDLAARIMRGDETMRVFDLRSRQDYDTFHLPTAEHATLDDLSRASFGRAATVVVYSDRSEHAVHARVLLRTLGIEQVYVLREGIYGWIARVHEPRLAADATPAERAEFERMLPIARFFGGVAQTDVPRSEVTVNPSSATEATARVGRRGC